MRSMKETLYPVLRSVDLRYYLRRPDMIKDTIHTAQIDTAYLRGRRLLEQRKYTEAIRILRPYDDRNMAIGLLSLGYDDHAYEILRREPKSAISEYLLALACMRLGKQNEALGHYNEAVRLDPNMEYRAGLDPELSELIKP